MEEVIAADSVAAAVRHRPARVIGLATGRSPLATHRLLADRRRRHELSFSAARAVVLDEYVGLPVGHPESHRPVIEREFVAQVDLDPARPVTPDTRAPDLDEYVGLPVGHPESHRKVIEREFVAQVDLDPARPVTPDTRAADLAIVDGPVSAFCPASVLRMHPHVTVLVDEPAASDPRLTGHHRETCRNEPAWQSL